MHYSKRRETRLTDRLPVSRQVPLQQPVANQKLDAAFAYLDRRDHDHAPGAASAQASGTDSGCRLMIHVIS